MSKKKKPKQPLPTTTVAALARDAGCTRGAVIKAIAAGTVKATLRTDVPQPFYEIDGESAAAYVEAGDKCRNPRGKRDSAA